MHQQKFGNVSNSVGNQWENYNRKKTLSKKTVLPGNQISQEVNLLMQIIVN